MSLIADFVSAVTAPPPPKCVPDAPDLPPRFPVVQVIPPPPQEQIERPTIAEARQIITAAIADYLAQPEPEHALLVRAAPGVGKTHIAVRATEALARTGKRVLYCGPRHDFFIDVLREAEEPTLWYEWLPHQRGDETTGKVETCRYAEQIATWLHRGYDTLSFCAQACGWDYINNACPYHAQKRRPEPCIFGQHQHLIAHPLRFDVVFCDEDPTGAFLHEWVIDARYIRPTGLDPTASLTQLLHTMAGLALTARQLSGPALLEVLGGPQHILDACAEFTATPESLPLTPDLRYPSAVEQVDYFHLPALVNLLTREARLALAAKPYLARVILHAGKLLLLLRRPVAERLPPHLIFLDGTGQPAIYESLLRRPVRVVEAQPAPAGQIIQVHNRTNSKRVLLDEEGTPQEEPVAQLQMQIEHVARQYRAPALITYQSLARHLAKDWTALHFYAARGTNALLDNDALIVAGTPMPPIDELTRMARMIFFERDEPFKLIWSRRLQPYAYVASDGQGRGQLVGGYWDDPDLMAVLWSLREAELIQACHRVRPLTRDVPVYLLSSLPLAELPPTRLLSIHELFGAPEGVDVFRWSTILWFVEQLAAEKGYVTVADLADLLNVSPATAARYFDLLAADERWEVALVRTGQRGRPARHLYKST